MQTPFQMKIIQTPEVTENTSFTAEASDKLMDIDDLEIIPLFPTSEVIQKIEEIPPLGVFYRSKHKALVSRQRKRKRTEQPRH